MGEELSGVAVLKHYFTTPPLTMDELKSLPITVRNELAEQAAAAIGYKKIDKDGKTVFVKA